MVISRNIVEDAYQLAVAVLRMRHVDGEPLAYQVYPGTVSVVAQDGRKYNALLAEARQAAAVSPLPVEKVVEETAVSPLPKKARRK